jgi:Protein of unknown function (DUF4236)
LGTCPNRSVAIFHLTNRECLLRFCFSPDFTRDLTQAGLNCEAGQEVGGRHYGVQLPQVGQDGAVPRDASKSGISYSAGVKGARITKRANGKVQTTLSAPGTGLRYTKTTQGKRRAASPAPAAKRAAPKTAVRTSAAVPIAAPVARPQRTAKPSRAPKPAPTPKPPRAAKPPRVPKPAPTPKPARARQPVRPPKPLKLRGRRSTTPPRIPSASVLPLSIKGNLATVTLHPAGIHIERTKAGRIGGNHSADISWHELAGIDFLAPSFFRNGHVHFATFNDPRGLTFERNADPMVSSARNPHVILFDWPRSRAYKQLRDLLTGSAHIPPPPHEQPGWQQQQTPAGPPPSWQSTNWQPQPNWQDPAWPPGNHPAQTDPWE